MIMAVTNLPHRPVLSTAMKQQRGKGGGDSRREERAPGVGQEIEQVASASKSHPRLQQFYPSTEKAHPDGYQNQRREVAPRGSAPVCS